jgi:hypothetical protein
LLRCGRHGGPRRKGSRGIVGKSLRACSSQEGAGGCGAPAHRPESSLRHARSVQSGGAERRSDTPSGSDDGGAGHHRVDNGRRIACATCSTSAMVKAPAMKPGPAPPAALSASITKGSLAHASSRKAWRMLRTHKGCANGRKPGLDTPSPTPHSSRTSWCPFHSDGSRLQM